MSVIRLSRELFGFAERALVSQGALVASREEALEVLLPAELRLALGLAEELLLLRPGDPEPARRWPGEAEALLARLARLVQGAGRCGAVGLLLPAAPVPHLARALPERYPAPGATLRAETPVPGQATYLQLHYLVEEAAGRVAPSLVTTLLAEETRLEPPGLLTALGRRDLPWEPVDLPAPADPGLLLEASRAQAAVQAQRLARTGSHQRRDWLTTLDHQAQSFAEALQEETATLVARRKLSDEEVRRRQQRLDEQLLHLQRLRDRLRVAATLRLRLGLLGGLRLRLPVLRVPVLLRRGRAERVLTVTYNPLGAGWEPLPCDRCGTALAHLLGGSRGDELLCDGCREKLSAGEAAGGSPANT